MADLGIGSSAETKITRPSFDGNQKNVQVWWTRYTAFAMVAGFGDMMSAVKPAALTNRENERTGTDDEKEAQSKAVRRNAVAITNFTMAFKAETLMALIYHSQSAAWPSGLAHVVVTALFKKYRPTEMIAKIEMTQELTKVKMKKDDDPAKLFENICRIENQFGIVLNDVEKITLVIGKAPVNYASVITSEQHCNQNVTIEDIEEVMLEHFRITHHGNDDEASGDESGDGEFALAGFKGICFICKEEGHKANDCPNKKTDRSHHS